MIGSVGMALGAASAAARARGGGGGVTPEVWAGFLVGLGIAGALVVAVVWFVAARCLWKGPR